MNKCLLSRVFPALFLGAFLCPGLAAQEEGIGDTETGVVMGKVEPADPPPRPRLSRRYQRGGGSETKPKPLPPRAVVYLMPKEGAFPKEVLQPPSQPAVMLQIEGQFVPGTLPVMVGSTVAFPNKDDFYHNVFSYSDTKTFDLGRYLSADEVPEVTFEKAGPVKVFCEIHNNMRATILVLASPHFTVADGEGRYVLRNVPPGEYRVLVWHNENIQLERPVTVVPGDPVVVDFAKPGNT